MVLIDCDVSIEQFDYSRAGDEWAVVRLLAALGQSVGGPPGSHLVIESGLYAGELVYAPARDDMLERRLLSGSSRASQLLWNVTFDMPLDVVEAPQAVFKLLASREAALALPVPWLRDVTPRALTLTSIERRRRYSVPRLTLGKPRRLAALGTALAITGTSVPALALAAGVAGTGAAAGVSHSSGSGKGQAVLRTSATTHSTQSPAPTTTHTTQSPAPRRPTPPNRPPPQRPTTQSPAPPHTKRPTPPNRRRPRPPITHTTQSSAPATPHTTQSPAPTTTHTTQSPAPTTPHTTKSPAPTTPPHHPVARPHDAPHHPIAPPHEAPHHPIPRPR